MPTKRAFLNNRGTAGRAAFLSGAALLAASQLVYIFSPSHPEAVTRRSQLGKEGRDRTIVQVMSPRKKNDKQFPILHRVPSTHIPGKGVPRL